MASLGSRITDYRRRKNVTQDQLAETMGVSSQAVSKWENDISCPDISLLPKLADYFGVSVDTLLRGEGNNTVQMLEPNARKSVDQMFLKVVVNSSGGDIVNVNLPLSIIKVGLEIGIPFLQTGNNNKLKDTLKDIDFDSIFHMAEKGLIGKIVEVKSAGGDIVEIYIE